MKLRLASLLDTTLARSPFQSLFYQRAAHKLTILAYHGVDDPDQFAQQLDFLRQHTHPVSLQETLDALNGQGQLPQRAVLITFDDGERSVLEQGMPLLQDRGLPAVLFVVVGLLDTHTPYWWKEAAMLLAAGGTSVELGNVSPSETVQLLKTVSDEYRLAILAELRATAPIAPLLMPQLRRHELAQLAAAGIAIGNHTLTHPCLTMCSEAKIKEELYQSHQILTDILGYAPQAFAYPNGDANEQTAQILQELGYKVAFLFDHQLCTLPITQPFAISRVRVDSTTSMPRFQTIVSGLHPAIYSLRGNN